MKKKEVSIGIDLGTSKCCVGVVQKGKVEILENERGKKTTPSCVAFTTSERLIGDEAKDQASLNPDNTVSCFKRLLKLRHNDGDDIYNVLGTSNFKKGQFLVRYQKDDKILFPVHISAMMIKKMKSLVEEKFNCEVTSCVIAVPSLFNTHQRHLTLDAAKVAGIENVKLVNETTASAIAYSKHINDNATRKTLIVDFGGGYLNVALAEVSRYAVKMKAVCGTSSVGGEIITRMLVERCLKELTEKFPDFKVTPKIVERLKVVCEKCKVTLSLLKEAVACVDGLIDNNDYTVKISRGEFNELIRKDIEDSLQQMLTELAKRSGMAVKEVQEVLIVGGSTRIPLFQDILKQLLPSIQIRKTVNADEAVTEGAAVRAALASKDHSVEDVNLEECAHARFKYYVTENVSIGNYSDNGVLKMLFHSNIKKSDFDLFKKGLSLTEETCDLGLLHESDSESLKEGLSLTEERKCERSCDLGLLQLPDKGFDKSQFSSIAITFSIEENGLLSNKAVANAIKKKKGSKPVDFDLKWTEERSRKSIKNLKSKIEEFDKKAENEEKKVQFAMALENLCFKILSEKDDVYSKLKDEARDTIQWLDEGVYVLNKIKTKHEKLQKRYDSIDRPSKRNLGGSSSKKILSSARSQTESKDLANSSQVGNNHNDNTQSPTSSDVKNESEFHDCTSCEQNGEKKLSSANGYKETDNSNLVNGESNGDCGADQPADTMKKLNIILNRLNDIKNKEVMSPGENGLIRLIYLACTCPSEMFKDDKILEMLSQKQHSYSQSSVKKSAAHEIE